MHNLMQEDVKNYSCFVQGGRHVNHTHSQSQTVGNPGYTHNPQL